MIGNDWDIVLNNIFKSEKFNCLYNKISDLYNSEEIYPTKENLFNAFKLTSFENTKVVIIGQDPYHGKDQAHGLSFSVQGNNKIPPSLKNIFKELNDDLNIHNDNHGDLTSWAKEGVLLLNSVLTVKKDTPGSHKNIGWHLLTDEIVKILNNRNKPVVFILWGNFAKEKKKFITNGEHLILESVHPSPFSARNGFFGSKVFSRANEFLIKKNMQGINWRL